MSLPSDTSDAARRHLDSLLRRMTPAEKFRRVLSLSNVARTFTLARMRAESPDESDEALHRRLSIELLPADLAAIMRARDAR